MRKELHKKECTLIIVGLIGLIIISFGWHQSLIQTITSNNGHYSVNKLDLAKFDSLQQIFSFYTKKMGKLGVHNNHYPPGNLLLLKVESMYWPYLSKSLVFLATFLALWPLGKLMNTWQFNEIERLITFIIFGTSAAIIFFPGIDMSSLMLPVSITCTNLMMIFPKNERFYIPVLFGILMGIFVFFSFIALFFGLFCIIMAIVNILQKVVSIKKILTFGLISISSFAGFFIFVGMVLKFNILDCFAASFINEISQINHSETFNWTRYLIISTGNIIAYIGIIGIPGIGMVYFGIKHFHHVMPTQIKSLIFSVLVTIFIMSFSNQFFLEVERIWLFLTPYLVIIQGWFIAQLYQKNKFDLVYSLILISMVTCCVRYFIKSVA